MNHKTYKIGITGETPLLLHHDNLAFADRMKAWSNDPATKDKGTPGDDRTPAWRWMGCLYVSGGFLVVDSDNLMTMLREGGKRCPTGKGKGTFKAVTQSGIVIDQIAWPIIVNGKTIKHDQVSHLDGVSDFEKHCSTVEKLGFSLFVKRARVNATKHVRVRPRFDNWALEGTLTVLDETITKPVLQSILTFAGAYAGLGDWRPSSPKSPGSFGKFTATVEEV